MLWKRKTQTSPIGRMRKIVAGDTEVKEKVATILLSDVGKLLSAYFDIIEGSIKISTFFQEAGVIKVIIECDADRIKNIKVL